MNTGYLIINSVFSMFSGFLMYIFLKFAFNFSCSKKRLFSFLLSFGVVNGLASTAWMKYVNLPQDFQLLKPIIALIVSVYTIKLALKTTWSKAVLSFFVVIMGIGIGNYLTPLIYYFFGLNITTNTTTDNVFLYFLANISIHTIALIITLLSPQVLKLRRVKNIKMITVLLCGLFVMMAINMSSHFTDRFELASFLRVFVSTIIYIIVCVMFVNKYVSSNEQELELVRKEEELLQQKLYNASFKESMQGLRDFKHNLTNHFMSISSMLRRNEISAALAYLDEIQDSVAGIDTAIFNVENAAVYGIVSSKIAYAKDNNVSFNLNVVNILDVVPGVKITELCEMLGILFDNAIEAAALSINKIVDVDIEIYKDRIQIKLSNSCKYKPDFKKMGIDGYSTKKGAGSEHGHGLSIIRKILNKYPNITLQTSFFDELMLYDQILEIDIKKDS